MITKDQILRVAEIKGWETDVKTVDEPMYSTALQKWICSRVVRFGVKKQRSNSWIWYTEDCRVNPDGSFTENNAMVFRDHIYNQANGNIYKGCRKFYDFEDQVGKIISC